MFRKVLLLALILFLSCLNETVVKADEDIIEEQIEQTGKDLSIEYKIIDEDVEDIKYSEEVMCFFASNEKEAKKIAENINCELIHFAHGVATISVESNEKSYEAREYSVESIESAESTEDDYKDERIQRESFSNADIKNIAKEMGICLYEEYIYYAEEINSEFGYVGDEQWYASFIGIPEAWQYSMGEGAKVAVIDSGVNRAHGELKKRVAFADTVIPDDNYDSGSGAYPFFTPSYKGIQDNSGHGTHVCGIIAATNDNYGTVGVAPLCDIISIKAIDKSTDNVPKGKTSWIVSGINEAIEMGVDVINLSIGGTTSSDLMLERAIKNATDSGIAVVCAAGNIDDGISKRVYPAACDGAIGVSALKQSGDELLFDGSYSNYGSVVDVSAPGTHIYSTDISGYCYKTGTSMAAPIVSASLGMLRAIKRDITLSEMKELLYNSASDLGETGRDEYYGAGAINTKKMLKACYDKYKEDEDTAEEDEKNKGNDKNKANNDKSEENSCIEDTDDNHETTELNSTIRPSIEDIVIIPEEEQGIMYALEDVLETPSDTGKESKEKPKAKVEQDSSPENENIYNQASLKDHKKNNTNIIEDDYLVKNKTILLVRNDDDIENEIPKEESGKSKENFVTRSKQMYKQMIFIVFVLVMCLMFFVIRKRRKSEENEIKLDDRNEAKISKKKELIIEDISDDE